MAAIEEVRQLAGLLAEEAGYELVDVEASSQGRRGVIRILLDKPEGITLGDCTAFSRRLSDCLDMNQTMRGSYHLEVSSPGIERPIRSLEAATRFVGQRISLVTYQARDGRRNYEGEILPPVEGRIGIRDEGSESWFDWVEVKSARLVVDPWALHRSKKGTG